MNSPILFRRLLAAAARAVLVALGTATAIAAWAQGDDSAAPAVGPAAGVRPPLPRVGLRAADLAVVVNDADPASARDRPLLRGAAPSGRSACRARAIHAGPGGDDLRRLRARPRRPRRQGGRRRAGLCARLDAAVSGRVHVGDGSVRARFRSGRVLRRRMRADSADGLLQQPQQRPVHRPQAASGDAARRQRRRDRQAADRSRRALRRHLARGQGVPRQHQRRQPQRSRRHVRARARADRPGVPGRAGQRGRARRQERRGVRVHRHRQRPGHRQQQLSRRRGRRQPHVVRRRADRAAARRARSNGCRRARPGATARPSSRATSARSFRRSGW